MTSETKVDVLGWIKSATVGLHCLSEDSPLALRGPEVCKTVDELIYMIIELVKCNDYINDPYWEGSTLKSQAQALIAKIAGEA